MSDDTQWHSAGSDEPKDQQRDLVGPWWAEVGPDIGPTWGWSWTILEATDHESNVVTAGRASTEEAAKDAVFRWEANEIGKANLDALAEQNAARWARTSGVIAAELVTGQNRLNSVERDTHAINDAINLVDSAHKKLREVSPALENSAVLAGVLVRILTDDLLRSQEIRQQRAEQLQKLDAELRNSPITTARKEA